MRVAIASAATVAILALAACGSVVPTETAPSSSQPAPRPDLSRFYDQDLSWRDCGQDQCAELTVPVDYADPQGSTIELAVLRRPANRTPGGVVVINPGGPGASGYDYADYAAQLLSPRLLDERDIVGFDPRGVGRSAPVTCGDPALIDELVGTDGTPDTPAETAAVQRISAEFASSCTSDPPGLLDHLSTQDAARDLDVLRGVLGQSALDYLGVSYGTHLGATYARLFPQQVGRFVLDAPVPANLDAVELSLAQAAGFEDSLRRFLADCLQQSDCVFGSAANVDEALAEVRALLERLDQEPATTNDQDRSLTEAAATYAILMSLYRVADRAQLRDALGSLAVGDGEPLQRMLDERLRRLPDGTYADNSVSAFVAITCSDRPLAGSVADLDADLSGAPFLGEYIVWGAEPCAAGAFAPIAPAPKATTETPTIVIVATTHDPATPLPFAALLADEVGNAVVITREGDGHTAYREGSPCIDDAIDGFLMDGVLPADGLACQ
jgi:pimeloyl-ACP methyl ester carboxylesterase